MERLFQTHEIRYTEDLEGIWEFQKLDGDFTGCEPCSEKMLVPSCWEMDPSCRGYRGRALYRKVIFTKRKSNLRLVFKGVSHTAEVYVNKKKVGGHYGAYTPFSILLPDAPEGRHEIELVVDNSFSEASALHKENDYYTYGGITRPVSLEYLNNVYIEKVFFTPRRCGNAWEAQIRVELHNLCGKPATLLCKGQLGRHISLDFGEVTVPAGRKVSFEKSFVLQDVKEWSPESPALYLLKMALFFMNENYPVDDWIDRVGFREIQVSGNRLLLNGRPIFLKGYNRHEDDPQFGCALPLAAQMRDLALMRETGANSVRTSHYPNDERFLDLCDSYGMLVWEEAHARGLSPEEMENPAFESQSRVCIQ
ncbi:MAG TPA: beta-glucuronidase, partial [Firmicutes bacterium]|nr:beta-glucuronidase [Bacillota bacterium]